MPHISSARRNSRKNKSFRRTGYTLRKSTTVPGAIFVEFSIDDLLPIQRRCNSQMGYFVFSEKERFGKNKSYLQISCSSLPLEVPFVEFLMNDFLPFNGDTIHKWSALSSQRKIQEKINRFDITVPRSRGKDQGIREQLNIGFFVTLTRFFHIVSGR